MPLPLAPIVLTVCVRMLPWSILFASHRKHESTSGVQLGLLP